MEGEKEVLWKEAKIVGLGAQINKRGEVEILKSKGEGAERMIDIKTFSTVIEAINFLKQ